MNFIVAVDSNWAIGCRGDLLQHIPEDMNFFKEKTTGKVVIMGRTTLESLPGQKPLKDRINIVLTTNKNLGTEGIIICSSLDEVFKEIAKYKSEDVYVIGGESVYKQMLPYCEYGYITKINKEYNADRYFTNLDELNEWEMTYEGEVKKYKDIEFKFTTYRNNNIKGYI